MTRRLLNTILTFTLFFCVSQVFSQNSISQKIQEKEFEITNEPLYQITEKVSNNTLNNEIPKEVLRSKQFYRLQSTFDIIKTNKQSHLRIMLPVNNQLTEFHLVKAKLFTPDFVAVTNGQSGIEIDKGIHYWGIAKNNTNSLIALSVFDNEIVASIQINSQSYTLSKYKNTNYHLMFKSSDLNYQPDFSCQAIGVKTSLPSFDPNTEKSISNDCVRIHVEADYGLYQSKGSSISNTTNYVNGLFNQVAIMYANESINIAISYLNIWTSTSPYTAGNELNELGAQNYGRTFGDLVHLLHRNGGGGVAYLDQLCSDSYNLGVSGVDGFFNNVPTYSWDVMVVSHELGHNVGSPHTHDCVWNGNNTAIDGCGYQASGGTDGCTGPIPSGGTIMSYCHISSSIDFTQGFGQQPGDLMRNRVANAACLSACGPPTCNDGYQNGDEEGIDCGGSLCIACPTCDDGILNQDETAVDCGGANCNACPCAGGAGLSLIINPDFYISETTWDVKDASGNIVASGGGYTNGQGTTVEALCLPPGCYDFTIYDSYGDGLFDGARTGTYVLIDVNGNNLVSGSGNFGPEETTNFCVTSACASIDMNILFDGFPGQSSWDITDANGNVVSSSGGTYGNQTPNSSYTTAAACLPDGCYTLNFYDQLGNGMCPFSSATYAATVFVTPGTLISPGSILGTIGLINTPGLCGNYNLTDANGNILASGGANFAGQQSNNFCLSGGLAPKLSNESNVKVTKKINNNNFSIQPNPVINQLKIYTDFSTNAPAHLQVVNILGEVVLDKTIAENIANLISVNVTDLVAGTYFVILKDGEEISINKFLKQ